MSYRNCYYNNINRCVELFTWDEDGKRVRYTVSHDPYLYLEDSKGEFNSIYNTKLKKKVFRNSYERSKFLRDGGIRRVFENLPPVQQYLLDTFWKENETADFTQHPIKICFLDIETYSVDSFPNPEDPTHEVTVITCYDSLTKTFNTFGIKPYNGLNKSIKYTHCKNEKELFIKFIEYLKKDYPDIMSGWNSEFFDIPYIINRCTRVLGEEYTKDLSPLGNVHYRDIIGKFGRQQRRYYIDGISILDYLDIYKRFCFKERDSYKLDNIGEIELGEKKVGLNGMTLAQLTDTDWDTFIDYNVQDVNIIVRLEEKLQYVNLLRMLSYAGLCTFEQAMGTLSVINGALCVKAREVGKIISTFIRNDPDSTNPGAYVAEPRGGFQEKVISFDANSLYPNVMISLNLSPETKVGKFNKNDDGTFTIKHVSGKTLNFTKERFIELIKAEELSITKANFLFTQKFKGVVPLFVDHFYNKRVEIKKELQKYKVELSKLKKGTADYKRVSDMVAKLNAHQMCVKVLINSCYGYFGNKQAPIGDDDIAASVTLTGQAVIKESNILIKEYLKEKLPNITDKELEEAIIYNDTDSSYVSIKSLFKTGLSFTDGDNKITQDTHNIVQNIEDHLNAKIKIWGVKNLNSKDCRFVFKRESIGDVGLFLQKKRYVLHVLDDEGITCNKFKYTGVEVVRTTMPNAIKPYAKKIIETMLTTKSQADTNKVLNETYEIFKGLPIQDVAFVMGLKGYDKYAVKCSDFDTTKSMPLHVKSSYYHNLLLDKLKLEKKYEKLSSGEKVRYLYVETPNKYMIESIAFKNEFPEEFNQYFKIDYDKMFDKILFQAIERFYEAVNWRIRKPKDNVQTELFDLFG
jgi:DNA polymerase elongation subunit (family B)